VGTNTSSPIGRSVLKSARYFLLLCRIKLVSTQQWPLLACIQFYWPTELELHWADGKLNLTYVVEVVRGSYFPPVANNSETVPFAHRGNKRQRFSV
jgi:hypothetical protein